MLPIAPPRPLFHVEQGGAGGLIVQRSCFAPTFFRSLCARNNVMRARVHGLYVGLMHKKSGGMISDVVPFKRLIAVFHVEQVRRSDSQSGRFAWIRRSVRLSEPRGMGAG